MSKNPKNLFSPSLLDISDILFNGKKYFVPKYQRDYSWTEENWEDLWDDLIELLDKEDEIHYMGTTIMKTISYKESKYEIIDGQQRLTTITLLGCAIIKFLQDMNYNNSVIEKFKRYFIGDLNIKEGKTDYKITLNKNDDFFLLDNIFRPISENNFKFEDSIISKKKYSNKLLYNALKYFYKKIKEKFLSDNTVDKKIIDFVETTIGKQVVLIQILVENDINAYVVFETLNSRGIELAPTDLLKNYLFSLANDTSYLEDKWYKIMDDLGNNAFKEFPDFLRYYLAGKNNDISLRKDRLYKFLRKKITSYNQVIDLLNELSKISEFYQSLNEPDSEFWTIFGGKTPPIVNLLKELNLFGVKQYKIAALAIWVKDWEDENKKIDFLIKFLDLVKIISFRYNVIGKLNPNELEKVYIKLAYKIYLGEIKTKNDMFEVLKPIYIDDNKFENDFANIKFNKSSHKLVKYILSNIYNEGVDFADSRVTIEHILPQNFLEKDCWLQNFDENSQDYIYRLGNMGLIEVGLNRKIGNKCFNEKKEIYEQSTYKSIKEIIDYQSWDKDQINIRQKNMAKKAVNIWKINL